MTVTFDAGSEATQWGATPDPQTFTHTPVGTPRAVVVGIVNEASTADLISGVVSYGGVTMTRVLRATDTTGGTGNSWLYFLGSGIPTGAQTVSIDHNAATNAKWAACATFTAADDTVIIDSDKVEADMTDPQLTLQHGSDNAVAVGIIFSGQAFLGNLTEVSGVTRIHDHDFSARTGILARSTAAVAGDEIIGWTSALDDVAFCAASIAQVPDTSSPKVIHRPQYTTSKARQRASRW